mmetsp:Transcript_19160/g.43623  ORF Transcript_19160/g.43623 Transcript_19160/m.43623 type:complete len:192 (-) Transcript_19160:92-667(-)
MKIIFPFKRIALQVAEGIRQMHQIDDPEFPTIAHTDITSGQFIMIDGVFKLNDFNRCRFMRWNTTSDSVCGYKVGRNPGGFRAPEEYRYDVQDEKVDIYSMGNIFYALLTKQWPFEDHKSKDIEKMVISGKRPKVPRDIEESENPIDIAMLKAMRLCWIDPPSKRTSAAYIVNFLTEVTENLRTGNRLLGQ